MIVKNIHVEIEISGYDRRGLLNEVLQAVNETKTNISAVSGKSDRNKVATINMTIYIYNIGSLTKGSRYESSKFLMSIP